MPYQIETTVRLTFKDGQILMPLQGQTIDLMKLDKVEEFRTVLEAIGQGALGAEMRQTQAKPQPQQPRQPAQNPEVDLSAEAERIRREFQEMSDKATEQLNKYAQPNANPA